MKSYPSDSIDNLTVAQTMLVRACLAANKAERKHYVRVWEEAVQIMDLDFSSSRLVPYLLQKIQQEGISCKHERRLKVIYKHWWLRTAHIGNQLEKVHSAFITAGIEVVIIKGASIKQYYNRAELRPMGDFDLLIPKEKLQDAIIVLREMGFALNKLQEAYVERVPHLLMDFTHALSWSHQSNDTHIDLHWKIGSRCTELFTDELWTNLCSYGGLPDARKPAMQYEIFMILIHAVDSSNKDNLNWIIDIAELADRLDAALWEQARQLAIGEKKTDLFDYACSVLRAFNVNAPDPGRIKSPRRFAARFPRRIRTIAYHVNRLYPHAGFWGKSYHFMRRLKFAFIARQIRKAITDYRG